MGMGERERKENIEGGGEGVKFEIHALIFIDR